MRDVLPVGHGLSSKFLKSSVFSPDGVSHSLTDIQFEALAAGAALGKSLLVVAPTSSGKTNVGLGGLISWIENADLKPRKAIYLTSHRALARQKFNEFTPLLVELLDLPPEEIVLSTGDGTVDASGQSPSDPSDATVLIGTYEKYLGLLSGAGIPEDLTHLCFICDELQIINDRHRGEAVEILLTLLRRAHFGQLIGLSAVIAPNDAKALSDWLGAQLVRTANREVPIEYELRTPRQTLCISTDQPGVPRVKAPSLHATTLEILEELMRDPDQNTPIAVFCMRRRDVFDLSKAWARKVGVPEGAPDQIPPDFVELTSAAEDLACYVPHRFAFHTADLIEQERAYVEAHLDRSELTVVFSTTTLAMGLNYSFKTVIFDRWRRWNFQRRQDEPIDRAEFHNIAGRAGRLGKAQEGRVIFTANQPAWERVAAQYLQLDRFEAYTPRLNPENFDHVVLQLLSSNIATSRESLLEFLDGTLSAASALEADAKQREVWEAQLNQSLAKLASWGFVR